MTAVGRRTTAVEAVQGYDLTGINAVVTGGNSGLGAETVKALALAGAHVVLCSRSVEAGEKVAEEIRSTGVKGAITVQQLDLADFASIAACAASLNKQLPTLNLLILNAGVMACPLEHTKQGFEQQIGVNHIGHFYLTKLLLPKLKASGTAEKPARVVAVASLAHVFGAINLEDLNYENRKYTAWGSYGQSKLANILFAKELARRMQEEGAPVLAYSLHPGSIITNLQRHLGIIDSITKLLAPVARLFTKSASQGAGVSLVAATAPDLPSGSYLVDCHVAQPTKAGQDMEMAKALWEKTEALVSKGIEATAKL